MIVKAEVAGFSFETTLELFFIDNPDYRWADKETEEKLSNKGKAKLYNPNTDAYCIITLLQENKNG